MTASLRAGGDERVAKVTAKRSAKARGRRSKSPRASKARPQPRNELAKRWLYTKRLRDASAPVSLKRQAAYVGALAGSLIALTIWLGGFAGRGGLDVGYAYNQALVSAGFTLQHVDVRGASRADAAEIAGQLMVERGEIIFNFQPAAAKARVEELAWVREASVLRLLPNRVVVIVNERQPLALWRSEDTVHVLDDAGRVILGANAAAYDGLPTVQGSDAPEAVRELVLALNHHPAIMRRAVAFERIGGRRWDIVTHTGLTVQLPEGSVEAAISEVSALQAEQGVLDLPLTTIDLRNGGLVLHPRSLGSAPIERGA